MAASADCAAAAASSPRSGPPPASLRALRGLLRRRGPLLAGQGEETMEVVVPALERAGKPTVNASGSPPKLRGLGKGRRKRTSPPAREKHPDSQPGDGPFDVREAEGETLGTFPGIISLFAQGGSTGGRTLVTMTILQLQFPWQLLIQSSGVSFLFFPGLHPIPSNSPCVRWGEGGAPENKRGVLRVTL